jgi:hypothetical protein
MRPNVLYQPARFQTGSVQRIRLLGQLGIQDLRAISRSEASRAIDRLKNGKSNGVNHGPTDAGAVQ